jgi:hypothetical protein
MNMNWLKLVVVGFALQFGLLGSAAARNESAQGNLTVTAVVQASVAVVIDAQGNPKVVLFNGAASADNVSTLAIIPVQSSTVAESSQKTSQKRKKN